MQVGDEVYLHHTTTKQTHYRLAVVEQLYSSYCVLRLDKPYSRVKKVMVRFPVSTSTAIVFGGRLWNLALVAPSTPVKRTVTEVNLEEQLHKLLSNLDAYPHAKGRLVQSLIKIVNLFQTKLQKLNNEHRSNQ